MALTLGWDYEGRGSFAVAGGWIASAERLLAGLPKAPEHGRLTLTHALTAMFAEGQLDRAVELFDEAYELATGGRRSRRADARALGEGASLRQGGQDRRGPRSARRGERVGAVRRSQGALRRARLLHHDQLLPGRRRLSACRGVDGGGEPLVRHARRDGLPGRMPDPSRRGDAASRRLARGGSAGARSHRGAQGLRPDDQRGRLLRDRRDPPAPWRPRRSRGGVPRRERVRAGAATGPLPRAARRGKGGRSGRRNPPLARGGRQSRCSASAGSPPRSRSRSRREI